MKILHIALQHVAELTPPAIIHGIAPDCSLTRAQTPASALEWLLGNRDTAAVIVEMQAQSCASFINTLRGLGLTTPVVVVAGSTRLEPVLAVLNSGADGYVVAGPTLEADLPRIVAAVIERERSRRQRLTQTLTKVKAAAAALLNDVQARHSVSLSRETRICVALQQRLFELETALREADERRAWEAVFVADQLASREAEFTASLAQTVESRDTLAAELSVATAALDEARQARRAESAAAAQHLRRRESELRADLAEAVAARTALERLFTQETDRCTSLDLELAAAEAARQETDQRHATELAELQARHEAALEEVAAAHAAFERQTEEVAAAFEQASRERIAEATKAAAQVASMETELGARQERLVQETDRGRDLEGQLSAATAREVELVDRLTRESEALAAVKRDLTRARMAAARGRDRSLHVISAYRRRVGEQKARFDRSVENERQAHERARLTSELDLQRVSAECAQIGQSFEQLQSAFQALERSADEHAAERDRLAAIVADRDTQLSVQAERHRLAEQGAQVSLAEVEEKLREAVDAGGSEIARLQQDIDTLRRELDASRTQAEALRSIAERVPDLQTQLERSQNERRRQFERAPYALCRCSQSGAITDANHAFVTLLGCRRVEELRSRDFVSAALDKAGDLGWLLERARMMRKTETVETHWKTRDGRRLVLRLQALVTWTGSIDIVAEDITGVRALEERLRQAQRMEAVGRLASEVAITCDTLLSDVTRGAHEWLGKIDSDDAVRQHAERLLTDVARAASLLRQLWTYGNEQVRALEPVSAQGILRDLAPVLKRLVGDQIELVLPKSAGSFNVDVDAERLERVLIIVTGYARERMPCGGQVRIDLATTAVGRRFVARHSNVRPGDHVLITVTELPAIGGFRDDSRQRSRSIDNPGVDLGVLLDLIASCGGHLWLDVQPAGNMVVKIPLPKSPAANAIENRGGRLSRWFRSASAANVGA